MSSEKQLPPLCPIRRSPCFREVCAWWVKESQSCVVVDFAISLRAKALKVRLE
ncbi:MAG: hypothetical protein ACP5PQ_06905 [Thermoproteota archaeon]